MSTGGFAGQPSASMPDTKHVMTVTVDLDISELIFGDLSNTEDVRNAVVAAVEKVLKADAMSRTVKVLAVEDHLHRLASLNVYNAALNQGHQAQANAQYNAHQAQLALRQYQSIAAQSSQLQQLNGLATPSGPHQWQSVPMQPITPPVSIIQRALNKIKGK